MRQHLLHYLVVIAFADSFYARGRVPFILALMDLLSVMKSKSIWAKPTNRAILEHYLKVDWG